MKYSVAATILAAASLVAAAPGGWDKKNQKIDYKKEYKGDWSPIDFTSTYHILATPDQVVSNVSAPSPGQPGAKGSFNYGIIADLNVICYVSSASSLLTCPNSNIDNRTSNSGESLVVTNHPLAQQHTYTKDQRARLVHHALLSPTLNLRVIIAAALGVSLVLSPLVCSPMVLTPVLVSTLNRLRLTHQPSSLIHTRPSMSQAWCVVSFLR
jgi:hypothetical protein